MIDMWCGIYQITDINRQHCRKHYLNIISSVREKQINKLTQALEAQGSTPDEIRESIKESPKIANAGLTEGQGVMKVLRVILNLAMDDGIILQNPAANMRISTPPPRQQVWKKEEMDMFMDKAEHFGRKSIADAFALGRYLGQRPADIRNLKWTDYNGHAIRLQQEKTKAIVQVECLPALKSILDSIDRTAEHIVVSEETNKPYAKDNFETWVGKIRDREVKDNQDEVIYPPIRKELQFKDLRRTAVVNLYRAGATTGEIASITGHNIESCQKIINTYFPKDTIAAAHGIQKLHEFESKNRSR
jgi:integrase